MTGLRRFVGLGVGLAATLTLVGLPVSGAHASPADPGLRSQLNSVMSDSRVTAARSGAVVLDGTDGRELYARYAWRAATPASNTKILTAVTAMHVLGPHYRFKTEVIRQAGVSGGTLKGDLYLKGYGDPTLRVSDLRALAEKVRAAGIRTVTGNLAVDASFFDGNHYNPGWNKAYSDAYYAAPVFGLTLAPDADYNAGTVQINYLPGSAAGKRARVSFTPAEAKAYVRLDNHATTARRGAASTFTASRKYGTGTIRLSGKVPRGQTTGHILVSVGRPDLYAAAVFRTELAEAGVTVRGTTKTETAPTSHRTVIAHDTSMSLSKLLVPFLKLSNNNHAEALTKAMGTLKGHPGNWADGLSYTKAYLRHFGVGMKRIRLVDGSGLSRSDKLTPRAVAKVLYGVQHASWFSAFYDALPVAGNHKRMVGGSLRHRMNGTRAANNAHAKTGSLTGVTALSGYVRGRDGRRYVFSMISGFSGASPEPVEDELTETLANRRR